MNKKLRIIIDNYGIDNQLKYFQSEVFELNEAIIKERKGNGVFETVLDNVLNIYSKVGLMKHKTNDYYNKEHIKEEIADVMVMLKQFQLYYDISTEDLRIIMNKKINRQIDRVKEGV